MKEIYFTPDSIEKEARRMMAQAQARPSRLAFIPERAALLVLDMQTYFLDPSSHAFIPSGAAIIPGIKAVIQAFRANGMPVIFTRHVNSPEDAGMMAAWWHDSITEDHPLSQIVPELDPGDSPVICKTQYDAFYDTELEMILRENGVERVLVSGVMTHLCCETTARSAFMRGFEVFFLVDGTSTYNQAFHRASLLNLAHGFATLMLCTQVITALENTKPGMVASRPTQSDTR